MSLAHTPQPIDEPTAELLAELLAELHSSGAMNAVTHGMTARRPLSEEEERTMIVIADTWVAKHLPETAPEEALIRASAIEYVRYGRCVRAEEARLRPAAAEAVRSWREKRKHAIRKKAQSLPTDPEGTLAELLESAFGIDWMIRHWRNLLALLDAGKGWLATDIILSMNLIGRPGTCPKPEDVDAHRLWMLTFRVCPSAFDPKLPAGLSDDAEALEQLRALAIDRIERLELLRPEVWEANDAPDERAAANASSSSRFDEPARPAPVPAPVPAPPSPVPATPSRADSRNEPVSSPTESPVDRRNSNPPNTSRADSAGSSSADPRRTGAPSDPPRTAPAPDARPSPRPAPSTPDRPA